MNYGKGKEKIIWKRSFCEKWDGKSYVYKQELMNCGNGKGKILIILYNRCFCNKQDGKNCEYIGIDELREVKRKNIIQNRCFCENWD